MKMKRALGLAIMVMIILAASSYLMSAGAVGGFATTFYDLDVIPSLEWMA